MKNTVQRPTLRKVFEHHVEDLTSSIAIPQEYKLFLLYGVSAAVYLIIYDVLFSLETMETINVIILSLCLTQINRTRNSHISSAAFATGIFLTLHSICSLPLFGQDVSGVILVRSPEDKGFNAILSGGAAGPENGLVFTILLVLFLFQRKLRPGKFNLENKIEEIS